MSTAWRGPYRTGSRQMRFDRGLPYAPVVSTVGYHVELFGGPDGSAHGYAAALSEAGVQVISVDNDPKVQVGPYAWFTGDWREGLNLALDTLPVVSIGASPPCTKNTAGTRGQDRSRYDEDPDIEVVREALVETGLPYVIENVESEVTRKIMRDPIRLCGFEFDLQATDTDGTRLHLIRHRLFEANFPLVRAGQCPRPDLKSGHPKSSPVQIAGAYGSARRDKWEAKHVRGGGYVPPDLEVLRDLMGAPEWMDNEKQIFLSIPPAYTAHIGRQLAAEIQRRQEAAA